MSKDYLAEGMRYKDLVGIVKPTVHIDEFVSKMGDDDDIAVMSFYVRDAQAAEDMVNWFEKGYDFVLDADRSPGELKPSRYLVYVELKRRSNLIRNLTEILEDLQTLTEHKPEDWKVYYNKAYIPFDADVLENLVSLSPKDYRARKEADLNEWRVQAGLQTKPVYEKDEFLKKLQQQAGF